MINFLQHRQEVISNFCNTFKKLAYKTLWGIDLNCNVKLPEFVWLEYTLLHYQEIDDCCAQCTLSQEPKNCIISQYGVKSPNPAFPFCPLTIFNQPVGCTYVGIGDFNKDFNTDFFK